MTWKKRTSARKHMGNDIWGKKKGKTTFELNYSQLYLCSSQTTFPLSPIQSLFPAIVDEQERLSYKRDFERDHQEYKSLQAELDDLNQNLAELDRELNRHPEGSPQFLVSAAGVAAARDKYERAGFCLNMRLYT